MNLFQQSIAMKSQNFLKQNTFLTCYWRRFQSFITHWHDQNVHLKQMIVIQKPTETSQTITFSFNILSCTYPFHSFTKRTYKRNDIICTSLQIVSFYIFSPFFTELRLLFPTCPFFFASSKIALVTTRRVFHVLGNNGKFFIITISAQKIFLFKKY